MSAPIDILFDAKCVAHNAAAFGIKKICIVIMISLVRNPVIKLNRLCVCTLETNGVADLHQSI